MKQKEFKSPFNALILDELSQIGVSCWVAGGALRDHLTNQPTTTDCDLFFTDFNNLQKTKKHLTKSGGKIVWESPNGLKINYKGTTYDLSKFYYSNPSEMFDNFDFTISQFATDGKILYYGDDSLKHLRKKKLVLANITNPIATFKRSLSHHSKGYVMENKEVLNLYKKCFGMSAVNRTSTFPPKKKIVNKKKEKMEEVYYNANGNGNEKKDNLEYQVAQAGAGAALFGLAVIGGLFYLLAKKVGE